MSRAVLRGLGHGNVPLLPGLVGSNAHPATRLNGDLGTILKIDLEEQEVLVQFAEREVSYDYADIGEVALAWAVTVHKSQGSEYPVVIFPLFMQHYILLSRNLLYTGLTRAKQLAILVGPTKAIGVAINRIMDRQRYTALADRLRHLGLSAQTTHREQEESSKGSM